MPKKKQSTGYSPEEDQKIKDLYPTNTFEEISKVLGYSVPSLRVRADFLGLNPRLKKWTDKEDEIIKKWYSTRNNRSLNLAALSRKLGRSPSTVSSRALFLSLVHTPPANRSGSRSVSGRRKDLGDIYFRSKWEANYARYLNLLKRSGEIKEWLFEPKRFDFPIKRGTNSYLPDFFVHYKNNLSEYHEIKGILDSVSLTKIRRMNKYYPDIKIVIIGKEEYEKIEKEFSKKIKTWEF
jgi:hypothetical protein